MARRNPDSAQTSTVKERRPTEKKPINAERSAHLVRREAAKVLRSTLQGDARRQAVGSIKSRVYSLAVRNKEATFALVCQTLKHLSIIKDVLEEANVLSANWKKHPELMYIIAYDLLFGEEVSLHGDAEKYLILKRDALQSALSQILMRKGVKNVEDLVVLDKKSELPKPRYVRVNTLKIDTELATSELRQQYAVQEDDMVPDLLILPTGADLHHHSLVKNGSIFLQGKASSLAAIALGPQPGWEVIDACSAPGNKTVHLAALMKGKGKIIACELNKERVERLQDNVKLAGATNVKVKHEDFLNLDPKDRSHSKVRAILLDPPCSGSGTAFSRLDHLLQSHSAEGTSEHVDVKRLQKLACFQKKALERALSFPTVERIVYSTCSIHQTENEDVVNSVWHLASSLGFQLATPFPQWPRCGLPTFNGSEQLLRIDPTVDEKGFFIALFVRKCLQQPKHALNEPISSDTETTTMFPQLPHDVILEILVRLPVKPLLRFKCVCKSWLSIISSRQFVKTHLTISKKGTTHHKLMVYSLGSVPSRKPIYDIKQCSVPSLLSGELIFDVVDPEHIFKVDTFFVWGSCDGLICLDIDSGKDLILWNPSTRIHRKLPDFGSESYDQSVFGFGFDKSSDDYKVVALFQTDIKPEEVIVKVYSLKSNRWKTIKDFRGWYDVMYPGAFAHGKLHWISDRNIVYIDLETEEYGVFQTPDFLDGGIYYHQIGASDGRLFVLCHELLTSADLWIMSDYDGLGKGSWTKVVTIPWDWFQTSPTYSLRVVNNGEVLLLYGSRIVIFDAKDCTFRDPDPSQEAYGFTLGEYLESLVSPVR